MARYASMGMTMDKGHVTAFVDDGSSNKDGTPSMHLLQKDQAMYVRFDSMIQMYDSLKHIMDELEDAMRIASAA